MEEVEVKHNMSRKRMPVENCMNQQVEKTWIKMEEERNRGDNALGYPVDFPTGKDNL